MLFRLFLLFTLVPALELFILLRIGAHIGFWPTLVIAIAPGFLGAALARRAGAGVLRQLADDLAKGIPPADRIMEGLLILVAGAFLIAPGVLTDTAGLLLLVPPIRRWIAPRVRGWLVGRFLGKEGVFSFSTGSTFFRMGPMQTPEKPETREAPPRFDHPVR